MIIDCFTYFGERDLLDVRMNVLKNHVDAFVLCEGNRTFQGAEREYEFDEGPFVLHGSWGKLQHGRVIHADLSCFDGATSPEIAWQREYTQRRRIFDALSVMGLFSDAWIMLSDVDEIPALESLSLIDGIFRPGDSVSIAWDMELYYYFVNLRCRHKITPLTPWWRGSIACQWETLRNGFHCDLQELRNFRLHSPMILGGGWHFSFLGGPEAIKAKIRAFAHTEYRDCAEGDQVERALASDWRENRDLFGRDFMQFQLMPDDSHLPAYLVANKERFRDWWYESRTNDSPL